MQCRSIIQSWRLFTSLSKSAVHSGSWCPSWFMAAAKMVMAFRSTPAVQASVIVFSSNTCHVPVGSSTEDYGLFLESNTIHVRLSRQSWSKSRPVDCIEFGINDHGCSFLWKDEMVAWQWIWISNSMNNCLTGQCVTSNIPLFRKCDISPREIPVLVSADVFISEVHWASCLYTAKRAKEVRMLGSGVHLLDHFWCLF